MELSYHSIGLALGVAITILTLIGAIATGPYGRRGVRVTLVMVSVTVFLGTAFWFAIYLGFLDQRRAIEARLSEMRAQAMVAGSPLGCLERTGGIVEAACAQTIFATAESLAAANLYTTTRLELLSAATRYAGPRTPQFDDAVEAASVSLQQDPFGLVANVLMLRKGCTADRCDDIAMFRNPERVWSNIRQKTFDANVANHAAAWRTQTPAAAAPAAAAAPTLPSTTGSIGGETRGPIPEKYTLPSSASIPPVSIMNDEPARAAEPSPAAAARERPSREPAAASAPPAREEQATSPAALPSPPAAERKASSGPAKREKTQQPKAPLSIAPQ